MMNVNKTGPSGSVLLEPLSNNRAVHRFTPYQKTFKDAATQTDNNSILYAVSGGFLDEFRRFKEIVENHDTLLASITQIRFSSTPYQVEEVPFPSSPVQDQETDPVIEEQDEVSPELLNQEDKKDVVLEEPKVLKPQEVLISIGPNRTVVPLPFYENIDWKAPSKATRSLLSCVFGELTLATSTMTGKLSPAFPNNAKKEKLDPKKLEDIISIVTKKCSIPAKEVRSVIKSKCADAGKILRIRLKRE